MVIVMLATWQLPLSVWMSQLTGGLYFSFVFTPTRGRDCYLLNKDAKSAVGSSFNISSILSSLPKTKAKVKCLQSQGRPHWLMALPKRRYPRSRSELKCDVCVYKCGVMVGCYMSWGKKSFLLWVICTIKRYFNKSLFHLPRDMFQWERS